MNSVNLVLVFQQTLDTLNAMELDRGLPKNAPVLPDGDEEEQAIKRREELELQRGFDYRPPPRKEAPD